MAEIAIPLLLFGSAYLYANSNESQEDNVEGNIENYTNIQNKTVPDYKLHIDKDEHFLKYNNMGNFHQKYYTKEGTALSDATINPIADNYNTPETQKFMGLDGKYINVDNVTHNNMTPYYSHKVGAVDVNNSINENVLDSYTGSGSQQYEKKESAPLFKPENNMQNVYGNQNVNDFLQSRVNPSLTMNNVKPWQEERVAPGLNMGYNSTGSDLGFNNGLDARDTWKPKTVDDLRVETNKKQSYSLDGHMGPAMEPIQNRGVMGKMIKKQPDTFYVNSPDRYFTTTGAIKETTHRSEHLLPDENRESTAVSYYGVKGGGDIQSSYSNINIEESKKIALPAKPFINLTAEGQDPASGYGYGKNSYYVSNNNRTTTNTGVIGNAYGNLYANIVEPIVRNVRHTRKTNAIGNLRESGNVAVNYKGQPLINRSDAPNVTNREMDSTKLDFNHLNVQRQTDGAQVSNHYQPVENQRATTNYTDFGNIGANQGEGIRLYNAAYKQQNNNNKIHVGRTNVGNMNLFNPYVNARQKDEAPSTNRAPAVYVPQQYTPNKQIIGFQESAPQNYNNDSVERMNPDLLSAFKNNPYTKPLNSVA